MCPSLNTWSLAFFKIFLFLEVMSSLGDTEKSDKNGGSLRKTIKKLAILLQFLSSLNQQINYHNRFEVHHKVVQQNNHLSLGKAGRGQAGAHSLKWMEAYPEKGRGRQLESVMSSLWCDHHSTSSIYLYWSASVFVLKARASLQPDSEPFAEAVSLNVHSIFIEH